ncbi:MAG: IS66 family transposase [Coriobacteriales bacterium]|jgi:transposase|nr:IS66 family transposase [Coriobacteriales bacterium]
MEKLSDISSFKGDVLASAQARIVLLERENELMREEIRLLRAKRFAPTSEKSIYISGQLLLFNEAEYLARKTEPEPDTEQVVVKKKRVGKRDSDLSGLLTERIDYTLSEDERICPCCGGELHEMDVEVRREIEYIPASVKVIEHATHVWACRHCQASADVEHTPIIRPDAPKALFPGSLASASLLAQIISDKYLYHLPLYRQEAAFSQDGLNLSRQTLSNWVVGAHEVWISALYEHMKKTLIEGTGPLHADETELRVLKEDNRPARAKSYMWVYRTGSDAKHPLILYEYKPSRSHKCPEAFLKGYSGYLQVDGYGAYRLLDSSIEVVCCWAHARREFERALKAMPEDKRDTSPAGCGLQFINRLFSLERVFAEMTPERRYKARLEKSVPVAEELYQWATSVQALPKSLLGRAVAYIVDLKPYLMRVFDDGRLELSNNRAERSIKPFVIGRKNWLFSNTPRGANASAAIFSIIETAKENHLRIYEYLKYLFEQLPDITTSQIDDIAPWSDKLPDHVKVPTAYLPSAPQ